MSTPCANPSASSKNDRLCANCGQGLSSHPVTTMSDPRVISHGGSASPWPRALTQKEIDEHPLDGWCNVYRNAYSIIWASEASAKAAVGMLEDCPTGNTGEYLRTVRVVEARPGMPIYTQRQVDLMLENERAAANRKAGRGLMEMLNGMGDMRRDGRSPATSEVITAMERTIEGLRASNAAKDQELLAAKAQVVKLNDQIDVMGEKLRVVARAMGVDLDE